MSCLALSFNWGSQQFALQNRFHRARIRQWAFAQLCGDPIVVMLAIARRYRPSAVVDKLPHFITQLHEDVLGVAAATRQHPLRSRMPWKIALNRRRRRPVLAGRLGP